jgi:hypothetical protein
VGMSMVCLITLSNAPTRLVSFDSGADASSLGPTAAASDSFESSQLSEMGAHVVPAKLVVSPQVAPQKKEVAKSKVKSRNTEVLPAAARARTVAPTLVRTSVEENAVNPQTLLFVTRTEFVQTRRVDAYGAVVWDLSVWQVTLVAPAQDMMAAGIVAKSI